MKELKYISRYVKRHGLQYILGIAALFAVDLMNVYIPRYTGEITDGLEAQTLDMDGVLNLILRILILGAIVALGRFFWRYFIFGASRSIEKEMRNDLFAHLETLSMRYYNEHKTGNLMAHFTNDLQSIRMFLGPTVITAFDATVMLVLVLGQMILYVDVKLTCIAVLPLILIIFGDYFYGKLMHRRFIRKQKAFSDLTDQVQEAVSGIRVIKAFVQEHKELAAFAVTNKNNQEKNLSVVRLQALFVPLLDLIVGISSLLTLLYGGYLAIDGTISLGQFVAFNSYIGMLVWPMIAAGECITYVSQGLASLKRIMTISQEQPDIVDGAEVKPVEHLEGDLVFDHLTFSYPGESNAPALSDICLHVEKGSTLAVLGRTGSGKTTLKQIPLRVLRGDIAYVPQDNFLFSDTLENNIAFGVAEKDPEAVRQAARDACIHDNIMDFPDNYQTMVGERGVTLSGGQKQRSSIARALLKNSPILILDDALSAVDTDTEEQILRNLKANRQGKTTLIIAHRISTIQNADHILVLDEGKIAEYGTHEELMDRHGLYRSIYEKQQLEKQLSEEAEDETVSNEKR